MFCTQSTEFCFADIHVGFEFLLLYSYVKYTKTMTAVSPTSRYKTIYKSIKQLNIYKYVYIYRVYTQCRVELNRDINSTTI